MFKEQMNKIKELFSKKEGTNDKKKIENLVFFLIVLIVTLIAINTIIDNDEETEENTNSLYKELAEETVSSSENTVASTNELEERIENILETMSGVGKVNVLITYSQSSEIIAMYNENSSTSYTTEEDSEGGTRVQEEETTNKEVVFTEENGESVPMTQTVINPKIEGVIVTAEGADDVNVKANIIAAVEAVTGVATHKIQVFSIN